MTKPIKMIGTMVLNGASDLLKQYACIDFPVNRYFIIDNSEGKFPEVRRAIREIQLSKPKFIKEIVVIENNKNLGFSGSVNQIVKQNTDVPYWVILSCDWHPKQNELQKLAQRLEQPFTAMLCDATQNGYSAMVFNAGLIKKVGMMDENFFPAYYEDNDHRYRMKLVGLEWELFPLAYEHKVSSTLHSRKQFQERNKDTFQRNLDYYIKKWGGTPGAEKFKSPFNVGGTIDYWPYDPIRAENQKWT